MKGESSLLGGDITEKQTQILKPSQTSTLSKTSNFCYLLIELGKVV